MKKRWLIPLFLVLILAIATFGASAYFNSPRDTTGYISSGTLDLKLGLTGAGPWENSVTLPWNFANMAPGDVVEGNLWMKNVGSIPARIVTFEWKDISYTPLADKIILTEVWDSKNTVNAIGAVTVMADTNSDGKTSLSELAALSVRYGFPFDAYAEVDPFLVPNDPQYLHMKFQFDPLAGNDLQGKNLSYGLTIIAEQVPVPPAAGVP